MVNRKILTLLKLNKIKRLSLHTPPLKGAAQRGDIKHAHRHSNGHLPSKVGISLPDQFHKSSIRTPQYFFGLSNETHSNYKVNDESTNTENDPNILTCIQIGNPEPVPFIQLCSNKIPELPAKTRVRSSTNNNLSRPSTAMNIVSYRYKEDVDKEKKPGLTMKYFGESNNVIGCFTAAKIPIQKRRPSTAIKQRKNTLSTPRIEEYSYRRLNGLLKKKQ